MAEKKQPVPFELPEDFLLGTVTSALQIEGGDRNNSWYRWAERGYIKDGSHCIVADDHEKTTLTLFTI